MPFGLRDAPVNFQQLMKWMVAGLSGCAVNLDDVVIFLWHLLEWMCGVGVVAISPSIWPSAIISWRCCSSVILCAVGHQCSFFRATVKPMDGTRLMRLILQPPPICSPVHLPCIAHQRSSTLLHIKGDSNNRVPALSVTHMVLLSWDFSTSLSPTALTGNGGKAKAFSPIL